MIDCFHVTHPDFPAQEILVPKRLFSVVVAPAQPFEEAPPPAPSVATPVGIKQAAQELTADSVSFIAPAFQRLTVDDSNEPKEENSEETPPPSTGKWITSTLCHRSSLGHMKVKGRWAHTP